MHRNRPEVIRFLAEIGKENEHLRHDDSDPLDSLEEAERQAEFAKQELDKGFPLLHAQALISCWTALEVYVENLLAAWLENEPSSLEAEAVKKLKVPLWEYHQMDAQERCLYTMQLLQRELSGPLTAGITAFEVQLRPFGLAGHVDKDISKDIFEANHLRNVLVHRGGVADRRLLSACPWLALELGEPVVVGHEEFGRLSLAIIHYAFVIHDRVRQHFRLEVRVPGILAGLAEKRSTESDKKRPDAV